MAGWQSTKQRRAARKRNRRPWATFTVETIPGMKRIEWSVPALAESARKLIATRRGAR